jgi:endonuclease/exonuclease/phosphatase family metal-dependent hydrolase
LHIWNLFCESVDKALDSDVPLLLVGDYNCDMLSNSSNYFKKILDRLNLENVVFEATNITAETGTCNDLCIIDRNKLINSLDVLNTPVCSTHAPVSAEISFKAFK